MLLRERESADARIAVIFCFFLELDHQAPWNAGFRTVSRHSRIGSRINCFVCVSCRRRSIVICNWRIVPALSGSFQFFLRPIFKYPFWRRSRKTASFLNIFNLHFWRKSRTKSVFERGRMHDLLCLSMQTVSPNLDHQALRNADFRTVSRHSRVGLRSFSDRSCMTTVISNIFNCSVSAYCTL